MIPRSVPCIDTGARRGIENNAFDREWLRGVAAGERQELLRFHRSHPTASIGRFQAVDRELRLEHCARHRIDVVRRPSGGGALYLDTACLQFSLVLRRGEDWRDAGSAELLAVLGRAVGEGLRRLGVQTVFKEPNDLEVGGRKIASVFAASEGDALLLQATVLLDADVRSMLEALRVPTEKLSPDGLSAARDRLTTLADLRGGLPDPSAARAALEQGLASVLGLRWQRSDGSMCPTFPGREVLEAEARWAASIDWSVAEEALYEALWRARGATLRVRARFIEEGRRFGEVRFAGDLHAGAGNWIGALERELEGVPVGLARRMVEHAFREGGTDLVGLEPDDISRLLELVADKYAATRVLGLDTAQANALMVFGDARSGGAREILGRASVMLVPYCAKPAWCKWRHLDGCAECGLCEVGAAYRMARERGMAVTTVTHYEHLVSTLAEMKRRDTPAYVGMCCSNFYIKRHRAFQEAGIPAVLMDISGANCYELKQEDQAYAGTFKAEARLDTEVLHKVMRFVPGTAGKSRAPTDDAARLEPED
jgi:lipoate---protein ligase